MSPTEDQTMTRDMARRFAAEGPAPRAAEWDRIGVFPRKAIAGLGFMGMIVPEIHGGAGADMATRVGAGRLITPNAAAPRDSGQPCPKEPAMAKLFASEMAERVCSDAIQTHGGYGYPNDFPVEWIYRDVRVCQIREGTSYIQRLIVGRRVAA